MLIARRLSIAFALALASSGCINWVAPGADRVVCESLGCSACATHVACGFCVATGRCVTLSAGACAGETLTNPSRCAAEDPSRPDVINGDGAAQDVADVATSDAVIAVDGPPCSASACGPCADLDNCDWDTVDSVCRVRGTTPDGHAVARSRRDCDTPSTVRFVNASGDDTAAEVCFATSAAGPWSRLFAQYPGGNPPIPIDRYRRTRALAVGAAGDYVFRFVNGSNCEAPTRLAPDVPVRLAFAESRWLVLYDRDETSRAAISFRAGFLGTAEQLHVRYLLAHRAATEATFSYEAMAGSSVSFAASGNGQLARGAGTLENEHMLLPLGSLASLARASITRPVMLSVASDRPLPRATGAFTLVLASPPRGASLPGIFLLLDESDESTTGNPIL